MTGSLLLAVFIAPALGGTGYARGMTMQSQLLGQAIGVGAVAVWSIMISLAIALILNQFIAMRVSEDEEREGLDLTSHGERAWEFD